MFLESDIGANLQITRDVLVAKEAYAVRIIESEGKILISGIARKSRTHRKPRPR